jgi:hypothetical protein
LGGAETETRNTGVIRQLGSDVVLREDYHGVTNRIDKRQGCSSGSDLLLQGI